MVHDRTVGNGTFMGKITTMATITERRWHTADCTERRAWRCTFTDQDGNRVTKQFAKRKDADAWLVQARGRVASGTFTRESTSITVQQAAADWIEHAKARGLERGTMLMMAQHREHLLPLIGTERLARLSQPRCEQLADALRRNHSPAMAKKLLQSFKGIIKEAKRRGNIASNPAADVRIETAKRHQPKLREGVDFPTPAEVDALIAATDGPQWRAFFLLASRCGLRASELRALKWRHVDLGERASVTVDQRADRYNDVGSPKSATSRRTIPLGPVTAQVLRQWKLAQPDGRQLVFGTASDRPLALANIHARVLTPLAERAGIRRYTLHSLRHFAISRWLAARLDLKLVQTMAGHATASMTLDRYGHLQRRDDHHDQVAALG
jgi:integrase